MKTDRCWHRYPALLLLVVSLLAVVATVSADDAAKSGRRPNVIVILADDLGYADVGFQGCKDAATPNIDSLARHGMRFSNGYVSHPFCSPTRAGLMTGRYQQRFGHENNPKFDPESTKIGLPVDQITLPQILKDAGYVTGAIGKWHLGAAPCFHPNARGFSDYFGFLGGGHIYLPDTKGGPEYVIPLLRNEEALELKGYMTDVLSDEAGVFIGRHKAAPFFLYLAYNAVHTPLQAPEKYLSRCAGIADERRRTLAAMCVAMDDGIGRVVQALRDSNIERDTLVFFLSDNGGPITVVPCSNAPLRGGKGSVYEGGIRVPFVAQWRGHLPEGKVYSEPVISLDFYATAAALAGAKMPTDRKMDGVDILPHVLGKKKGPPHGVLHWRSGQQWAIREGCYKLLKRANEPEELYDLAKDIGETKNLAGEKPDVVAKLKKAHESWNAELIAPIFESPRPAQKGKKGGKKSA
jgi:arylsulfatase A-like enzyme